MTDAQNSPTERNAIGEVTYLDDRRMMIYEVGDNWGDDTPHIIGTPVEVVP